MKNALASCAAVLTTVLCLASSAFAGNEPVFERVMKTKTINCGYFVWAPYVTKDANSGQFAGINYEIMEAITKNLGLKLNWSAEIGAGDATAALNTGKADAICISLWPSPTRTSTMTFTNPVFHDKVYAVVRADDNRFDNDLEKANRKEIKVSGIDGDVTADMASEKLPNANPQLLPQTASGADILMYILTKKADIAMIDEALYNDFSKTNPGKLKIVPGIGPVRVYSEHIAVKEGEYHLRDMINVSLQQLVNDGLIEKITAKYSKQYKSEFIPPRKSF